MQQSPQLQGWTSAEPGCAWHPGPIGDIHVTSQSVLLSLLEPRSEKNNPGSVAEVLSNKKSACAFGASATAEAKGNLSMRAGNQE